MFRPGWGPHDVVLRQGQHVRGAHPGPYRPKGARAESHHARRHRPGQAYEEAHMRKRPALCPPHGRVAALVAIPDEVQPRNFGSVCRTDGVGANAAHT